jgi:hypothetical protein
MGVFRVMQKGIQFFIITSMREDGLYAVDPQAAYQLDISGVKVLKITPMCRGHKVADIYGKVLFCAEETMSAFFIILTTNKIFKLDRELTGQQMVYLCNNPSIATNVASFKLLKRLLQL